MMMTNKIELNKGKGLTIKVINEGDQEQTIYLNGSQITITVRQGKKQSVITQTPTEVLVEADKFTVKSQNISCTADIEANIQSGTSLLNLLPAMATLNGDEINVGNLPGMIKMGTPTTSIEILGVNVNITSDTLVSIESPLIAEEGVVEGPPPIPPVE
jgi:hypothetical protein